MSDRYVPRLKALYNEKIQADLQKRFNLENAYIAPRLDKIVLNMGIGEATADRKHIEGAIEDLTLISGQRPIVTRARRSIAGFKLRQGMAIGAKVTLRGERMYEFLDRLITIALPRVRDFRGLNPKSFDGRGNFSMGVREQIVFSEINYDKVSAIRGLDICVGTTAKTDAEALALLKAMNMPFPGDD